MGSSAFREDIGVRSLGRRVTCQAVSILLCPSREGTKYVSLARACRQGEHTLIPFREVRTFDIPAGAVLAEDVSKDYWIDTADEAPLGSIFGHKHRPDLPDGRWEFELAEDRVWIVMSNADAARYETAREQANNQPEGQYLMNGLYLPALVAVLNDVDQNVDDYSSYRWFASLDQRLEAMECRPLGDSGSNRLIDAQKLLDHPFPRMPIIANAEIDGS